jgi:hypothetical protein
MEPVLDSESRPYYLWREERFLAKEMAGRCGGKEDKQFARDGTSGWRTAPTTMNMI